MTLQELVPDVSGVRLDKFLASRHPQLSRSSLQKLIEQGLVTVNGKQVKAGYKLEAGDMVALSLPELQATAPAAESIPLEVVYEDADIIVIDKPAGMTVHPAAGQYGHTLVNALLSRCPSLAPGTSPERPGIVHRLDKDTSGLMVAAKTVAARDGLIKQFRSRSVVKTYTALAQGLVSPREGIIEAPIGRDPRNRKRMAVVEGGKDARTSYRVMEYRDDCTLLEVTLQTGRTHQIRVHLAAIGHPVVGDSLYGGRSKLLRRQFLHAARLVMRHPLTSDIISFSSALPADLEGVLKHLSSH